MDKFSKEKRSKIMSAIRGKGTKIEDAVARELFKNGIRFRRNVKDLPGTPDIAIKKYKIAIFLDSCFWHGCPEHFKMPKSNKAFWANKIEKNIVRDSKIDQYYTENNWHLVRIWEHDLNFNFKKTTKKIITLIHYIKLKNLCYHNKK